jgi:hypothetical protein
MAVKQPGLRGEMNAVAAQMCTAWVVWWRFWRGPSTAGSVLSCWLRVLDEYWRDRDNNSCCDGNDFVFATHRISAAPTAFRTASASLGDKKKQKEISREREASKGREEILFIFLLLVCLPHRNFAPTGIHKLSDLTHHFFGKR